jgi:hypothetical protein
MYSFFYSETQKKISNRKEQEEMRQANLEEINIEEMSKKLSEGQVQSELKKLDIGRDKNKYLLKLDNGLYAVFKSREAGGIKCCQNEIMAFHMASRLFGLTTLIPPAVAKSYRGFSGILQYYVTADIDITQSTQAVVNNIERSSYADLQVFRYIACIHDTNIEGLIAWKNFFGKYMISSIDNESIYPTSEHYGETIFGKTDIDSRYTYARDTFTSRYTSFFNPQTMLNIEAIDEASISNLYREKGYEAEDGYIKQFLRNRDEVLAAYRLTLDEKKQEEGHASLSLSI